MLHRLALCGSGAMAVAGADCVRTAPTPQVQYWVASDVSQYSPVVRLRVTSSVDGSRLRVVIDSGLVTVSGEFTTQSPVVMTQVYLTAYVAAANVGPMGLATDDSLRFADRRGWRAVAASDSVFLVDKLRYGERFPIDGIRLELSNAVPSDGARWLVFRISGKVVDLRIPFDKRGALRVGALGGVVRVYACSDRDLAGRVDTTRSNALRRAYGLIC